MCTCEALALSHQAIENRMSQYDVAIRGYFGASKARKGASSARYERADITASPWHPNSEQRSHATVPASKQRSCAVSYRLSDVIHLITRGLTSSLAMAVFLPSSICSQSTEHLQQLSARRRGCSLANEFTSLVGRRHCDPIYRRRATHR